MISPAASTSRPYVPIHGGPWFIVRADTKELLCNTNRLKPSFWSRQWLGALNYTIRQTAMARVWSERKKLPPFEYTLLTEEQVKAEWAKLDKKEEPKPEPEVLRLPEQQEEAAPVANVPSTPKEREPDPVQNELALAAMAEEVALMAEEAAAYELWQQARTKLRNKRKQRRFLEASCKCARNP